MQRNITSLFALVPSLVSVLTLFGCNTMSADTPAAVATQEIEIGYVVLVPSPAGKTVPLARLIVNPERSCPEIQIGNRAVATIERTNPHPSTFKVKVCEAVYAYGIVGRVGSNGQALPVVKERPRRVLVVGDTGCYGGEYQNCGDAASWPFGEILHLAVQRRPDLLIHVGDFNYRGTPGRITVDGKRRHVYDAGDGIPPGQGCQRPGPYVSQNVADADWDNWSDWRDDFFIPSAHLLSVTPLVAARGNHELCSRAGPGWFYFLGPSSPLVGGTMAGLSCASDGGSDPIRFVEPYRLDLGGLNLLVLDSANACDFGPLHLDRYREDFQKMRSLADGDPTWLITHRPLWGLRGDDDDKDSSSMKIHGLNQTLQRALIEADEDGLPPEVNLVLSGHLHLFQTVRFEDGIRPSQIVIGNSGVKLANRRLAPDLNAQVNEVPATIMTRDRFGFLELLVEDDGGWRGEVLGLTPGLGVGVVAKCQAGSGDSYGGCEAGGT